MWIRYLVSQWVRNEATRRAQEAVAGSLGAKQDDESPDDEPPPRCELGVIFALPIESGGLIDLLEDKKVTRGAGFTARVGTLQGRRIVVVESGAGPEHAAHATAALIAGHQPKWIISAGLAGALDAQLGRADLIIANSVANEAGARLAIDLRFSPTKGQHVGRLLTVDRIIRTPAERLELGQAHDALAVDMESYAVAEVCRQEKVRFLCFRAISDTADQELPKDIEHLMNQTTRTAQAGAVVGSLFRRPSSVKDMWKLREDALVASDKLAKFLREIVEQLLPEEEEKSEGGGRKAEDV